MCFEYIHQKQIQLQLHFFTMLNCLLFFIFFFCSLCLYIPLLKEKNHSNLLTSLINKCNCIPENMTWTCHPNIDCFCMVLFK